MVGYETEDKAYCMELTNNYGIDSYTPGTGLTEFGIYVPDVAAAIGAAVSLGFRKEGGACVVVGPDGYRFRLLELPKGRTERFLYVLCRVNDTARSSAFYKDLLGFTDAELPDGIPGLPAKFVGLSYTEASHPHGREPVVLALFEDGIPPVIRPWEGRHAIALDAAEINSVYKKFKAENRTIMHDQNGAPIELQEKLGTLFIFIAKDPDGYELCLVSRETMLPAAVEAVVNYDSKVLDWDTRDRRIAAIAEAGKEVEALIAQHPVVLFSKAWCPFCKKAKTAFKDIKATIFVKELEDENKAPLGNPVAMQEYLAAKTNLGKSVPKVFIQGSCIGGGDDTMALYNNGQLLSKCVAVGAAVREETMGVKDPGTHYFVDGQVVTESEYLCAPL